ncbi:MAG TPA: DUF488 domain-containing protein [Terriglobia bacterium]|nr:DUF488 domain-containing protein [Terriglobia bacterium]
MARIRIRRVYEPPADDDGFRVLVDGLWPRGLSKERAGVDLWLREIAPSAGLRRWFGHDPKRWKEFVRRYRQELRENPEPVKRLRTMAREKAVTLLFAAKDEAHNNAVALQQYLDR